MQQAVGWTAGSGVIRQLANAVLGKRCDGIDIGTADNGGTGINIHPGKAEFAGQIHLQDRQIALKKWLLVEDSTHIAGFDGIEPQAAIQTERAVQLTLVVRDPADQFAAQKAARAQGQAIIGCYHSHPGGQAQPSAADLAGAGEEDFLWLIASGETLNAFVYSRGGFARLDWGADWVTSSG